jgi:nitronate monooxygenase
VREELPSLRIGKLEAETPIVLGGMSSGLTRSAIAGAIANEGGFGTIGGVGLGFSDKTKNHRDLIRTNESELRREIQDALEISNDGNIGVNLMVATTDFEESVKISVEEGAKYIVSGAGLPLRLPELVEKYKVSGKQKPELIPIVSSARAGELIFKRWSRNGVIPSAFVVETPNTAGGHLGVSDTNDIGTDEYSLESVVPKLVKTLESYGYDIPVIAAGGI